MSEHEKISYVEFPAKDLNKTKSFFMKVFNWSFQDYGPEYTAFFNQGIDGGFYQADLQSESDKGAALIVFYSQDLSATLSKIQNAGGIISRDIFTFPGGRRFHFSEPSGNEFAVWSDKNN